jgi:hypothetical protein
MNMNIININIMNVNSMSMNIMNMTIMNMEKGHEHEAWTQIRTWTCQNAGPSSFWSILYWLDKKLPETILYLNKASAV